MITKITKNLFWILLLLLVVFQNDVLLNSFVSLSLLILYNNNIQKVGAAGVIIADATYLCRYRDTCTPDDVNETCEDIEPIMADDGSGADITVPSFLMFKQDADVIKKELKENNQLVQIEMSWSRLNPTNDKVQ